MTRRVDKISDLSDLLNKCHQTFGNIISIVKIEAKKFYSKTVIILVIRGIQI